MSSTLCLRPACLTEISQGASWSHCLAKCHLERERIDFAHSQLKAIEVYYIHEQQVAKRQMMEPHLKGTESCKVYGLTPQQFIHPHYFTQHLHQAYRQRQASKRMCRQKKQKNKFESDVENASKSVSEVLSALRTSLLNRRKEVEERSSIYVSEVIQEEDDMKVEYEFQGQLSQKSQSDHLTASNHAQQLLELQQQEYQRQVLQQQYLLAEQQRRYQDQQEQEYQIRLLQHRQHEEHQRHLHLQQLQCSQTQQAQPPQGIRTGTRSRANARSSGSVPPVTTSTPIPWVVAAAAKISSLQSIPSPSKDLACPEVEMVDLFFPMVTEDDRMDIEFQHDDDDKMVIDSFEMVKSDSDCVMMEVESDDEDSMME
ncbi:uncharacterized protein MELLADRAFT_117871 [Melampsora larici-populina 98AG31]|uniref:Uncharacterized protein n=1 Tax=Melampsora larici-populina (strain 98AG31 / pathotype 3-4-7) TaxID=747676 RepID=F4S2E2_MELLP|nr:uncharacterized protein MELLADRAFT_117871 [Melampsora larici-populina 98AG31]EGG01161.1 hypothetical protein MELLADRAFT_117871 [Melampsora larici-populina 98AG31]